MQSVDTPDQIGLSEFSQKTSHGSRNDRKIQNTVPRLHGVRTPFKRIMPNSIFSVTVQETHHLVLNAFLSCFRLFWFPANRNVKPDQSFRSVRKKLQSTRNYTNKHIFRKRTYNAYKCVTVNHRTGSKSKTHIKIASTREQMQLTNHGRARDSSERRFDSAVQQAKATGCA